MASRSPDDVTIAWGQLKVILPWSGWALFVLLFIAVLVFLYYLYRNPEQFDAWLANIDRLLLRFGLGRDKRFIQRDIRSRINKVSKKINKEAEGLVTKGVDIIWVNQDNIESFLRKGRVIVRMRHHENHDKNIVNATSHYVAKGILHTAKIYLPGKIQTAVDLALVKKILCEEQETGTSIDYFSVNILQPVLNTDAELKRIFTVIEKMEKKGLFTRILLREIRLMGKRLYPSTPTKEEFKETEDFFNFLEPFATHSSGDIIRDWEFTRDNIRIGILLVARRGKLRHEGYRPYTKQINEKINRGVQNIYIFGRNPNNVEAVKKIAKMIRTGNDKVAGWKVEEYTSIFRGEVVPAICIVLKTSR